jgi:hypothetical protein
MALYLDWLDNTNRTVVSDKRTVGTVWQLGRERRIFRGQGVERLKGREPDELAKR